MKITIDQLVRWRACSEGADWFIKEGIEDSVLGIQNLIKKDKLDWANWLICRVFTNRQKVQYAVYASKQVLKLYQNKYPKDNRPALAIKAAEVYLRTGKVSYAADAAYAANAAAYAAYAANAAAYAANAAAYAADAAADAAYAANAAAYAANAAAYAANAAADAANAAAYAANAAAYAAGATRINLRLKILKYGLRLLK